MPILIKNIQTEIGSDTQATVDVFGIIAGIDLEDYVNVPGLIAMLQNYLKAISVTELFVDGLDAYRSPDDGYHPILTNYGFTPNNKLVELTIDYS